MPLKEELVLLWHSPLMAPEQDSGICAPLVLYLFSTIFCAHVLLSAPPATLHHLELPLFTSSVRCPKSS